MYTSATPKTPAPSPASLLRQTGAGYFPIALIARLPFAMMVVGVLTLVVAARDSIALGGATSAPCSGPPPTSTVSGRWC